MATHSAATVLIQHSRIRKTEKNIIQNEEEDILRKEVVESDQDEDEVLFIFVNKLRKKQRQSKPCIKSDLFITRRMSIE